MVLKITLWGGDSRVAPRTVFRLLDLKTLLLQSGAGQPGRSRAFLPVDCGVSSGLAFCSMWHLLRFR